MKFDSEYVRALLKRGRIFQVIQLVTIASTQLGVIFVFSLLSPEDSGVFTAVQKMLLPLTSLALVYYQPYWSYFATMKLGPDIESIRRTLIAILRQVSVVSISFFVLIYVFGNKLAKLWIPELQNLPDKLLTFGALCTISMLFSIPLSYAFNGLHEEKYLLITSLLNLILSILIGYWLTSRYGLFGPFLGTLITNLFTSIIPGLIYINRLTSLSRVHQHP
jgi:O-antigen/teichoic acid export membrane protein